METKIKYRLPVDKNKITKIYTTKSLAHRIYKNSIDYIIPIGTPIKAAADGIVVDIKDDSDRSGPAKKYEKYENFIEIKHRHDECSYYGHLKKGGILVKIGQSIRAGQIIGYSGKTGWMANIKEPHLHFMVGKYINEDYKTLKIGFKKEGA